MRDITAKQISLRTARGIAFVSCQPSTLERIKTDNLPKGDLLNVARAAGFLAAKNTHNLIPLCHPVRIDAFKIDYEYLEADNQRAGFEGKCGVIIYGFAKSIDKTGIEMEVLTGISITALTIYDLLKPVDKDVEITGIKLLDKTGGKSDREQFYKNQVITAGVLVCSDAILTNNQKDATGILTQEMLQKYGVTIAAYQIVPENATKIQQQISEWVADGIHFIFTIGDASLKPDAVVIKAVEALLEEELSGVTEAIRNYRGMRNSVSMLHQGVAGTIGKTTVITLPKQLADVQASLNAILPTVFHTRKLL